MNLRVKPTAENRDGVAAKQNSFSTSLHADCASAAGSLITNESILLKLGAPIIGEATMRRPCYGVLVNSGGRAKKSRNEVLIRVVRRGGDDDASSFHLPQTHNVNFRASYGIVRWEF